MKENWSDLDLKTKIAYVTAIGAFLIGWGLTIAGFCLPIVGEVSESVLWILGQALVYAASVLGIGMYVSNSMRGMKKGISDFMREERRRYHQEAAINEYDEDRPESEIE